eukprot:TRINITY_DN21048_c0_g1_i1.p1 TRINITY_DN21048_c0_g1~~TRINITY_DN21048_c0_g1_i1.p1  ORF type:complete len:126 (+),score=3.89 TRINITY_DN21048_c0_g1_i1:85-462(+)
MQLGAWFEIQLEGVRPTLYSILLSPEEISVLRVAEISLYSFMTNQNGYLPIAQRITQRTELSPAETTASAQLPHRSERVHGGSLPNWSRASPTQSACISFTLGSKSEILPTSHLSSSAKTWRRTA